MNVSAIVAIVVSLVLNLFAWRLELDYLWSVLLVFGGVALTFLANAAKVFSRDDWKLFGGFVVFSNVCTLGVEVVMLHCDVWGFSDRVQRLSGLLFLGYPVEEFVYWAMCPAVVAGCYMVLGRRRMDRFPNPVSLSGIASLGSFLTKPFKDDAKVKYTPDAGTGKYRAGARKLVYIWLQVAIVASIALMSRYSKDDWKAVGWTTLVFFATAFPNELYALSQGFWLYNERKLLGIYLFGVPVEGFAMYFIAPVCACMILDLSSGLFGGKPEPSRPR